jgi:hypothetical protein
LWTKWKTWSLQTPQGGVRCPNVTVAVAVAVIYTSAHGFFLCCRSNLFRALRLLCLISLTGGGVKAGKYDQVGEERPSSQHVLNYYLQI